MGNFVLKEIGIIKFTGHIAIVYSRFSNMQVFLKVVSLKEMMKTKMEAFLQRKEIRDIFDMEFLVNRGIEPD